MDECRFFAEWPDYDTEADEQDYADLDAMLAES